MSKITIIGKGFVGKNLADQYSEFDCEIFDSKNINFINQKDHNIILCAAPSGKKWLVNQNKENDLNNIICLINILKNTKFKKLVLLSTIDVYQNNCIIENEKSLNFSDEPYGANRKLLESQVSSMNRPTHILRLPALFGNYLEKNYIYDLMNNNMLNNIKLNSSFQWFPIVKLKQHIEFMIYNNISLMNLSVQPVNTETIIDIFFPYHKIKIDCNTKGIFYDMRSSYTKNNYFLTEEDILMELKNYIVRHNN